MHVNDWMPVVISCDSQEARHYGVRRRHDRRCQIDTWQGPRPARWHDFVRALPAWGETTVEVPARDRRPARTANVRITAGRVNGLAPRDPRGQHGDAPLTVWGVYVGENDPPEGVDPVEWVLLPHIPVETAAQARERVEGYAHRWIIEEFHKAQKTGCGIELPQFTTCKRLEPGIARFSVVAVELLLRSSNITPVI